MIRCKDLNEAIARAEGIIKRDEANGVDWETTANKLNQLVIGTNANDMRCRESDLETFKAVEAEFEDIFTNKRPVIVVSGSPSEGALSDPLRFLYADTMAEHTYTFKTALGYYKAYLQTTGHGIC